MRLGDFFLAGPGFDGDDDDFPRHDEAAEADGDVEGEHGIELVPDHDIHDIRCLYLSVYAYTLMIGALTLSMKISPPEIRQNEPISSDGGRAGR